MGVHKLWSLLQPCSRPVNLADLAGQRVAVDISIWLTQFVSAMRDHEGRPLPHAHLLGMFRRICRLLFHKIRPVFVFDGPAINLKKRTISQRRRVRKRQRDTMERAAERLLMHQLQLENLEQLRKRQRLDGAPNAASPAAAISQALANEPEESSSSNWEEEEEPAKPFEPHTADELAKLPLSEQMAFLEQQRQLEACGARSELEKRAEKNPATFSQLQLTTFLKTSHLQLKANEIRTMDAEAKQRSASVQFISPNMHRISTPKPPPPRTQAVVNSPPRPRNVAAFVPRDSVLERPTVHADRPTEPVRLVSVQPIVDEAVVNGPPVSLWAVPPCGEDSSSEESESAASVGKRSPAPLVVLQKKEVTLAQATRATTRSEEEKEEKEEEHEEEIEPRSQSPEDRTVHVEEKPSNEQERASSNSFSEAEVKSSHSPQPAKVPSAALLPVSDSAIAAAEVQIVTSMNQARQVHTTASRATGVVTDEMVAETKGLLCIFGLPFVVSPGEAEAQCATLERLGLVDAVISDDSDVFLFGAQTVYRHFFDQNRDPTLFDSHLIRQRMGLGREDLVCLALLVGSDYTMGVHGVGMVNAAEILCAFRGFDALADFRNWVFSEGQKDCNSNVDTVRKQFQEKNRTKRHKWAVGASFPDRSVVRAYLEPLVDCSTVPFLWGQPDERVLVQLCETKFGWDASRARRELQAVLKPDGHSLQTSLRNYVVPKNCECKFRSERLRRAVRTLRGGRTSPASPFTSS